MSESDSEDNSRKRSRINPICQAKNCDETADCAISSKRGHPKEEWKLCKAHFNDTNGEDPWNNDDLDWIVNKLYYRCPSGGKISHNLILDGGYHCGCGELHLPKPIDNNKRSNQKQ